jgi:hypothetical protein
MLTAYGVYRMRTQPVFRRIHLELVRVSSGVLTAWMRYFEALPALVPPAKAAARRNPFLLIVILLVCI